VGDGDLPLNPTGNANLSRWLVEGKAPFAGWQNHFRGAHALCRGNLGMSETARLATLGRDALKWPSGLRSAPVEGSLGGRVLPVLVQSAGLSFAKRLARSTENGSDDDSEQAPGVVTVTLTLGVALGQTLPKPVPPSEEGLGRIVLAAAVGVSEHQNSVHQQAA